MPEESLRSEIYNYQHNLIESYKIHIYFFDYGFYM